MAKTAGNTRTSTWRRNYNGESRNLYFRDGKRVEYYELEEAGKSAVKQEKKMIVSKMYQKLQNVTTNQVIDNGERIEINYTNKGLNHFANDAMLTLSGKYFSEASMIKINEILEKAEYIPTRHELSHPRTDKRSLWFTYSDSEGRGVYFKVAYNKDIKKYELYSLADKI